MPILEYVCEECAHPFETIVFGSRQPVCPVCSSQRLERRLSVFAVGGQRGHDTGQVPFGPCGACGDPRGPGACAMD